MTSNNENGMTPTTRPHPRDTDDFGIERVTQDDPGFVDRYRQKWPWFDHLMRMNERYSQMGGSQYSAGITYFSVLSMFPILMLAFAVIAFILAGRPDYVEQVQQYISRLVNGQMGESVNSIIEVAISQRGTIAGLGAFTAVWSGLGWLNNLRYGVSKMWKIDPTRGSAVMMKLKDLLGLVLLFFIFVLAAAISVLGSSGVSHQVLIFLRIDQSLAFVPLLKVIAILLGVVANFVLCFWLIAYLPRTKVPRRSAFHAALIAAVAFEVFKQVGSMFFSSALTNPAGATFGPIIGVMVLLYILWQILLYCSAWAATTEESLAIAHVDAPEPAVIRIRQEVALVPEPATSAKMLGIGAALGLVVSAMWRGVTRTQRR